MANERLYFVIPPEGSDNHPGYCFTSSGALRATQLLTQHGVHEYPVHTTKPLRDLCRFCEGVIASTSTDSFVHQPGYGALCRSAESCPLCRFLYTTLIGIVPIKWIEEVAQKAQEEGHFSARKQDYLMLKQLPRGRTTKSSTLRRFLLEWSLSMGGFKYRGDQVGIYTDLDESTSHGCTASSSLTWPTI